MRPVAANPKVAGQTSASTKTGGPPLSVTIVARDEERTLTQVLAAVAEFGR